MARELRLLDNESGIVEVSSRTQHGRYLMRPSAQVNELILGILGYAQAKYDVVLYAFIFLSNHFHILMQANSVNQMSRFIGLLKSSIAKELGDLARWKQHFWGDRYHSAPVADSEAALISRFRYILANGCKENLVASPLDWPGVSSIHALCNGETRLHGTWYDRTLEYRARNRGEGRLYPSRQVVRLTPLPFLAAESFSNQQAFIRNAVHEIEYETKQRQVSEGTRPLGVRAILRQSPRSHPKDFHPSPAPRFHVATREEYRELLAARDLTVAAYRDAAARLREGERDVRFPVGTFPPAAPYVESRAPS